MLVMRCCAEDMLEFVCVQPGFFALCTGEITLVNGTDVVGLVFASTHPI